MKEIVFIIDRLGTGGAQRQVIDDLNELKRRQISVKLITLQAEKKRSFKDDLEIFSDDWHLIEFKNPYDFRAYKKLMWLLKDLEPEILISHLWFANTISRITALFIKIPTLIIFEHNVYDTVKTWKQFFADFILQGLSTKIVAVSETVKKSLVKHGINKKRIEVILDSIDVSKFREAGQSNIRTELNIKANEFIFVFIGRLTYQKAVDVLLESFKDISDAHLLIVGDGEERESLKKKASTLNLKSRVHFLGIRHDVPNLLKSSDAFVLPSRFEGVGIVVLEAMAGGLPIIMSDFEAGREIVDRECALIVPRESSQGLRIAMKKVMSDGDLRSKLTQKAKEKINNFDIGSHVDKMLKLISTTKS